MDKIQPKQKGKLEGVAVFILNKYQILLTRFRHQCVITVPCRNPEDPTQLGSEMDAVAAYVLECEFKAID
jgi:hypothetical protein